MRPCFYLIQIVLLITLNQDKQSVLTQHEAIKNQCNIFNDHYRGEYLYSPSSLYQFSFSSRNVYTWLPFFENNQVVRNAKKGIFEFIDRDDQAKWELLPVKNRLNTYFIRNYKYGEYLYASSFHKELWRHRRFVYTWKDSKKEMDEKDYYMWELRKPFFDPKKSSQTENFDTMPKFTIWNVKYNQSLYAASQAFSHKNSYLRRGVFTYYKQPDENKFNWFIVCNNN